MTWQKYTRDILSSHLSLWWQFQHDFSYKVHMYYSTATDPSRLFSRTFHAVLLLNYSNNPRVTVNKEHAQCCHHIVSHTTMQSRIIWHLTYTHTLTHTHTHPFNGPLSRTTWVSWYQKGKNHNLNFTEARDSEWQWHQLGRMQVYTSLHR